MTRITHEITEEDVGKPFVAIGGQLRWVSHWIGRILPQDVGKHAYLVGDVVQVESDEQFRQRAQ